MNNNFEIDSIDWRNQLVNFDDIVYLATSQAGPCLTSFLNAFQRYQVDRSEGVPAKNFYDDVTQDVKQASGRLINLSEDCIAIGSSVAQCSDLILRALNLRQEENIVVDSHEYASFVLSSFKLFGSTSNVRICSGARRVEFEKEIANHVDSNTRAIFVSHVSFYDGLKLNIEWLRSLIPNTDTKIVVDASQSLGCDHIDARQIDVLISCCHKWLLGPHGLAILAWNRERWPDLEPHAVSQHSVASFDFPITGEYTLKSDAERLEVGTLPYQNLYLLRESLRLIEGIGINSISLHNQNLRRKLIQGLAEKNIELVSPQDEARQGGNVCFRTPNIKATVRRLLDKKIHVVGGLHRIRVSPHVFNSVTDIDVLVDEL